LKKKKFGGYAGTEGHFVEPRRRYSFRELSGTSAGEINLSDQVKTSAAGPTSAGRVVSGRGIFALAGETSAVEQTERTPVIARIATNQP